MANEYITKDYLGGAVATTLNGAINDTVTTIVLTDGSTYPTGASGPFVIVIGRTLVSEEKILCTSRTGNTITALQRGYDGTGGQAHSNGAAVEHVLDALSIKQANAHASAASAIGSMSYRSGTQAYTELPLGATGLPIVAGASAPAYGALGLSGISATLLEILCPAGTFRPTAYSTADSGWAVMGTTITDAQTLTPVLWGKAPVAWRSGANLVLPTMTDKVLMGAGTTTLGSSGGDNTRAIAVANLPASPISINPPSTTVTITDPGHSHTSTYDDNGGLGAQALSVQPFGITGNWPTTSNTTGITATVDIAPFDTANLGSGTELDVTNAHLAVTWQIKAH